LKMRQLALDYLRRAEVRLRSAGHALSTGDYPDVVRFSQECVELALKAALRAHGVEYPKEHDVGGILEDVAERFPEWFREEIERIRGISSDLAAKRAASLYGLELAGKAPSDLFSQVDAQGALHDASYVLQVVRRLLQAEA